MSFLEEHAAETYRSMISVSVEGFKTLLLINGGAVVAMLAYLGQSTHGPELAARAAWPLGAFIVGLGCAAVAFVGSYATQFALYNETVSPSSYKGPRHMVFVWATLFVVVLSFSAFACGAVSSVRVLSSPVASCAQPNAAPDAPKAAPR